MGLRELLAEENEADLLDLILEVLEDAGVIHAGGGADGFAVETITGMTADLTTRGGQRFTLSIDTL
jgi:hypothetical protein